MTKNYIIGYGSLINGESQNVTGLAYNSIPIVLKDYVRSWSVLYDDLQFCALGVYPQTGSKVNGVLFQVDDLVEFDKREHGYHRIPMEASELETWFPQHKIPNDGLIWMYVPQDGKYGEASEQHYIWQSYVDVILMGCVAIDAAFAQMFIESTNNWILAHFKDDRAESAYIKRLKYHDPDAIDLLLQKLSQT